MLFCSVQVWLVGVGFFVSPEPKVSVPSWSSWRYLAPVKGIPNPCSPGALVRTPSFALHCWRPWLGCRTRHLVEPLSLSCSARSLERPRSRSPVDLPPSPHCTTYSNVKPCEAQLRCCKRRHLDLFAAAASRLKMPNLLAKGLRSLVCHLSLSSLAHLLHSAANLLESTQHSAAVDAIQLARQSRPQLLHDVCGFLAAHPGNDRYVAS